MSDSKNTKATTNNEVENAEDANTQAIETNEDTQMYEVKTYKRTIVGAKYDSKTNCVFLRFDAPFYKGDEKFDSFGKGVNKLCECGAHPLFILVVMKGIKPVESACLFIGAQCKFDVVFAKSGEVIDGYKVENDGWYITGVKIAPNTPSEYFIEAAKAEKDSVSTL